MENLSWSDKALYVMIAVILAPFWILMLIANALPMALDAWQERHEAKLRASSRGGRDE